MKKVKSKKTTKKTKRVFSKEHYNSDNGMLTSVWGPPLWHFLHTTSFNYPIKPTKADKIHYKNFHHRKFLINNRILIKSPSLK